MARDVSDATPIGARSELTEWIASGEKPRAAWRIGTEHEKIPFRAAGLEPVPYEGENGIRALLESMRARTGWEPILEEGRPIGLADDAGGGAISLEPGGQFELSGAPLADLHQTRAELDRHLAHARAAAKALGVKFLSLGMSPLWSRAQTPVMPKARYRIMSAYMPRVGNLGLDMMYRTATVQANMDYESEADMTRKLRVSLALQPVATALFANSPFTDGKPNGFLSMRSQIWRDTDPHRTGMMDFAFEEGFGYEAYVEWALDVPMYFLKRGDDYIDVAGASFRDLLEGRFAPLPGERATRSDWANHVSTLFPEVRLKRYLEMRGADVGGPEHILALSAFWTGLLYDAAALDEAHELTREWSAAERAGARASAPREGLAARIGARSLQDVARDALSIASRGLARRARANAQGQDERIYLEYALEIAQSGLNPAARLLEKYHNRWRGSVLPAFEECVF